MLPQSGLVLCVVVVLYLTRVLHALCLLSRHILLVDRERKHERRALIRDAQFLGQLEEFASWILMSDLLLCLDFDFYAVVDRLQKAALAQIDETGNGFFLPSNVAPADRLAPESFGARTLTPAVTCGTAS